MPAGHRRETTVPLVLAVWSRRPVPPRHRLAPSRSTRSQPLGLIAAGLVVAAALAGGQAIVESPPSPAATPSEPIVPAARTATSATADRSQEAAQISRGTGRPAPPSTGPSSDRPSRNPTSSAYGIPQALPGEKMASAGADWATNPATQIEWGLGYIRDSYGSPCAANSFKLGNGWY